MVTALGANLNRGDQQTGQTAGPCVMVLFGAGGDLTKRKLVPALFNLVKAALLPANFAVLGLSVEDLSLEQFRDQVTSFLAAEDHGTEAWLWFTQRLYYLHGDFADPATYSALANRLAALDRERQTAGNSLFYLATAPKFFAPIVRQLGNIGLANQAKGH